jgi:hypothetical protein
MMSPIFPILIPHLLRLFSSRAGPRVPAGSSDRRRVVQRGFTAPALAMEMTGLAGEVLVETVKAGSNG